MQGDILAVIDTSGTEIAQYVYDAWGNHNTFVLDGTQYLDTSLSHAYTENGLNNKAISEMNPFRYRGYYYDTETGLYYLNARYYDSEVGRFINADDISYAEPDTINGLNLYAYCANNPVMYIDPDGHAILSFLIGLLIAAVTFAVVNTGVQLVGDIINYAATGKWDSGWEEYVGAFIGGLAGGATFFITHGNLVATFAVMGGVETLSTNLMTNATGRTNYSGLQILGSTAVSVGIGLIAGKMGGTKVSGITIGRNSFIAVWKSGLTKLAHGTATKMSAKVILKGLMGIGTMRIMAGLTGGITSSIWDWMRYILFKNKNSVGYKM